MSLRDPVLSLANFWKLKNKNGQGIETDINFKFLNVILVKLIHLNYDSQDWEQIIVNIERVHAKERPFRSNQTVTWLFKIYSLLSGVCYMFISRLDGTSFWYNQKTGEWIQIIYILVDITNFKAE